MEDAVQVASGIEAAEHVRHTYLLEFGTVDLPLFGETTIGITSWMITFWVLVILLVVLSLIATRKMTMVPKGLQNLAEWGVDGLQNFFTGIVGKRNDMVIPLLVTYFIFILVSNYSGLLPLAGHLPGFAVPTSYLSVTAGFALVVFFCIHYYGFKGNGLGYFKHFVSPVAFLLPLLIIEELVKPFSLAMRLYGNIFGEEEVVIQLANLVPIGVPVIVQVLAVLFGLIQALVFTLLTSVYISVSSSEAH